jgi:hypothetical protein
MTEDSLRAIVETERELMAALAEERQRSAEWLAEQRAAIDREGAAQWAAFRETCQSRDKAAREAAAREAAAFLEQSRQSVAQFDQLDDAIIERIVVRRLRALLPREGR